MIFSNPRRPYRRKNSDDKNHKTENAHKIIWSCKGQFDFKDEKYISFFNVYKIL